MGGDLNLKKSWHPVLMSNQRRVWEEEKKALDERKRTDQMMKERAEERQIQELQELQEAAGGKKRMNRVDWMYSGPTSGQTGTTEEMEGYLLGKRRLDGLLKTAENKKLEKGASEEAFMALQKANTIKDTAAKIRDDPMLAIKKQEQAAFEAMMNDPLRRAALLKAAGAGAEGHAREKDTKHRKHRHRHEHARHRSRHEDQRERYREDRERRPYEDRERRSHDDYKHSREQMHSTRRRTSDGDRNYEHKRNDEDSNRRTSERQNDQRWTSDDSSSRSPPRHHRRHPSPPRHRKYSPAPRPRSRSPERSDRHHQPLNHSKGWTGHPRSIAASDVQASVPAPSNDKAAKLAAMQHAASALDLDREKRLAALSEREKADQTAEESARLRASKHGGKGDFIHGMNRKAGEMEIGERLRRGKRGLEVDGDA